MEGKQYNSCFLGAFGKFKSFTIKGTSREISEAKSGINQ
jgi:hypothetical protein